MYKYILLTCMVYICVNILYQEIIGISRFNIQESLILLN